MKLFFIMNALFFLSVTVYAGSKITCYEGTGFINYAGYKNCIYLENKDVRVVLSPHCGGRILEYSLKGKNSIYLDPKQDGWIYKEGERCIDPYGGRFDIGPEMVIPKHPVLWLGKWEAKITGRRTAKMISRKDTVTGVQLIREFKLDKNSSHLRCKQIIKNVSKETKEYCHWSRTLAVGGGICFIPLTPNSRFPKSYVMYGPGSVISYRPKDPNIKIDKNFIEITGTPGYPKLGFDSYAGWFAYLMPDNLLFVKKFPVYRSRVYNEIAGLTISIYYYKKKFCELEPIGPREIIKPGRSVSYTEDWWLLPYDYPQEGKTVNREDLVKYINSGIK